MQRAFSLVELSIVLVILGLLTGGILAGQSLIRASELRSATAELQRYSAAGHSFRDKYMTIPGDMSNATRFWSRQQNVADCVTNSAAAVNTAGTCDGDGDGLIENAAAVSQYAEIFTAWQHLALAGLVEGSYSGIAGSGSVYNAVVGTNVPRAKLSNAGWTVYNSYNGITAASVSIFEGDYGRLLFLGAAATSVTNVPVFTPQEAWTIDTKLDDGKPGVGKVVTREVDTSCHDMTPGATAASTANYRLTGTDIACSLIFKDVF